MLPADPNKKAPDVEERKGLLPQLDRVMCWD